MSLLLLLLLLTPSNGVEFTGAIPPDPMTITTKPQLSTESPAKSQQPKVTWVIQNYTANLTGPSTKSAAPESDRNSLSSSLFINWSQFLINFSSTNGPGRTTASGRTPERKGRVSSTSDNGIQTVESGGESTTVMVTTPAFTTDYPDWVDEGNGSSTVCLFMGFDEKVVDVVVYLALDLVLSVLAITLGAIRLIIWLRTKKGRSTNSTCLEGAWQVTYCTCCLIVIVTASIYWAGAKTSLPLDYFLFSSHLLRTKTTQLLVARIAFGKKKLSSFVATLLFVVDIVWCSLLLSLTTIILEGCPFCQRSIWSSACLTDNLIDFAGVCGGTVVYCGVLTARCVVEKEVRCRERYSSIPKGTEQSATQPNGGVITRPETAPSKLYYCLRLRVSVVVMVCHQVLSFLFMFGIFVSKLW